MQIWLHIHFLRTLVKKKSKKKYFFDQIFLLDNFFYSVGETYRGHPVYCLPVRIIFVTVNVNHLCFATPFRTIEKNEFLCLYIEFLNGI